MKKNRILIAGLLIANAAQANILEEGVGLVREGFEKGVGLVKEGAHAVAEGAERVGHELKKPFEKKDVSVEQVTSEPVLVDEELIAEKPPIDVIEKDVFEIE